MTNTITVSVDLLADPTTEAEKQIIKAVLTSVGNDKTKAAQMLQVSKSTFRRRLIRYGIEEASTNDNATTAD